MEFKEWLPYYDQIVDKFDYNPEKEHKAAEILSLVLRKHAIKYNDLKDLVSNKPVLILGAGGTLDKDLIKLRQTNCLSKFITIATDGATSGIMDICMAYPHLIITDLDGKLPDIINASNKGSTVIVHGNEHNIKRVVDYTPRFTKKLGTTWSTSRPNVHNFGGFLDGDRAICMALSLNAEFIVTIGMDYKGFIGKYSRTPIRIRKTKQAKLKFSKSFLEKVRETTKIKCYNATTNGMNIKGFKKAELEDIEKIM
tara:strand:+ start:460 stop:1221 length:762 start_codon:yes stop_codon:yes gene_type:complete